MKTVGILFLVACVVARLYRAKLQPMFGQGKPIASASAAIRSVGDLATHELAELLAARFKDEASAEKRAAEAKAIVDRVRQVLDPGSVPKA